VQNNKSVVLFLAKFFGAYLVLFLLYSFYIQNTQVKEPYFACSPLTKSVANQTKQVVKFLGYTSEIEQHTKEVSVKLFVNDKFVARVIEGCNAISIIILFIAFIVAFSSTFKATSIYILVGSVLIYGINIFRIALISIAIYEFPQYESILHDYLFPGIIYGTTFLLWFIWIRKFSKLKK
jgi:exosortase family protein XrtF